jgi:hypothetical protein
MMVLKRWSYLLVVAWLINALVCFHPTTFYESGRITTSQNQIQILADNTLVDMFFHHIVNQSDHHHKPISHRNRFINVRSVINVFHLPSLIGDERPITVRGIVFEPFVIWLKIHFISALHAYLFRLSPF